MRNVRHTPRLHRDLIEAKKAETIHQDNPFEQGTRIWRFFNKVREANKSLREPCRDRPSTNTGSNYVNRLIARYVKRHTGG